MSDSQKKKTAKRKKKKSDEEEECSPDMSKVEYKGPAYPGTEDDGTDSQRVQLRTEASCESALRDAYENSYFVNFNKLPPEVLNSVSGRLVLERVLHRRFIRSSQAGLPGSYSSLEVSQTWLLYWSITALDLLNTNDEPKRPEEDAALRKQAAWTLSFLWDEKRGGFAGAPRHLPHMVATYAGVHACAQIGTPEAYAVINREKLYSFLMSMKLPDGSFSAHNDGESDMRTVYGAITTAALTNVLTPELSAGVAEWIGRCQTYEGGIGGVPGNEAHGGYAFCAMATLSVLNRFDVIDMRAFVRWLTARQIPHEGGFQGRSNKLVDACYSWWQGSIFAIIGGQPTVPDETANIPGGPYRTKDGAWLMNSDLLQMYILGCAQDERGGLRDKPTAGRDLYHICYALCGLSIAQQADPNESIVTPRNIVVCISLLSSLHCCHCCSSFA